MDILIEKRGVLEMDNLLINENKNCEREYNGEKYARYAIRTPLITKNDNIVDVARTYAAEHLGARRYLIFLRKSRRLHAKIARFR